MNISDPDLIISIHKQYVAAGADVIQTNTYGANEAKLRMYGLENQVTEINRASSKTGESICTEQKCNFRHNWWYETYRGGYDN